jgi:hypothetical protein
MMVGVAALALLLQAGVLWRRHVRYRHRAELHAGREWRFHRSVTDGQVGYPSGCELDIDRAERVA